MSKLPKMSKENIYSKQIKKLIKQKSLIEKDLRALPRKEAKSMRFGYLKKATGALNDILKYVSLGSGLGEKSQTLEFISKYAHSYLEHLNSFLSENLQSPISEIKIELLAHISVFEEDYQNRTLKDGKELESEPELEEIEAPYIKEKAQKDYTLVLDLDETLVHYHEFEPEDSKETDVQAELRFRPGVREFLAEMAEIYELVVFTAGQQDYADWAID